MPVQRFTNVQVTNTNAKAQVSTSMCGQAQSSIILKSLYRNGSWPYMFSVHTKKVFPLTSLQKIFQLHKNQPGSFDHPNFQGVVGNIVEIDEAGIGGQSHYKHANKKIRNEEGATISGKTSVLGMKERGGNVKAFVIPDRTMETLLPAIYENVKPDSILMTDELAAYQHLKKDFEHHAVNHSAKQFVNKMASTNGIENFWSHLKRGIDGIYHQVSKGHLQSYIDEFTLRFNTRDFNTQGRFDLILSAVSNKRLTYQQLIK